jgi:hypothetical protein
MIVALFFCGHGKMVPPQPYIQLPMCATSLSIEANGTIGMGLHKQID